MYIASEKQSTLFSRSVSNVTFMHSEASIFHRNASEDEDAFCVLAQLKQENGRTKELMYDFFFFTLGFDDNCTLKLK